MSSEYQNNGSSGAYASGDPYAQFYYWDSGTNNWAFDYDGYYRMYGYPQAGSSAAAGPSTTEYDSTYAAQAYQQASAYGGNTGSGSLYPSTNETGFNADGQSEKRKKLPPGPKDAEGNPIAGNLKKGETRTTVIRKGPGNHLYEDLTLLEWDPTHKRLFVGDLGNDVTDEMLTKAFEKYTSFSKAKVIRKKQDNKARGFGFVSFADPHDFLNAWKEMDGKYIGSRPCRLKRANEEVNPTTIGARKDKLLAANAKYDAYKFKSKMGGALGGDLRRHGIGKAYSVTYLNDNSLWRS
jgi:RNA recognition motif. (a.k.a. RRM, RBD, or RNP domain)